MCNKLVFIHGFLESSEIWNNFTPLFGKKTDCILIDLPGFGLKSPIFTNDSIELLADYVYKKLDTNLTYNFIGHSLGGYVLFNIAEKHPEIVDKLFFLNSNALSDSDEKKIKRLQIIEFIRKNGLEKYIHSFIPDLFYLKNKKNISLFIKVALQSDVNSVINIIHAMRNRSSKIEFLKTHAKPTIFIFGEKDTLVSEDEINTHILIGNNTNVYVLENTGHVSFVEKPKRCYEIIKNNLYLTE